MTIEKTEMCNESEYFNSECVDCNMYNYCLNEYLKIHQDVG
ncbi:hypothetical protein LCGC14_1390280 [marine sediment metagenome]|uniref:Uncharacterized protein n=1 Tax=marine sediment metagenome TaxID=412755 RepID=A0A0F9MFT0_9ZZZZ